MKVYWVFPPSELDQLKEEVVSIPLKTYFHPWKEEAASGTTVWKPHHNWMTWSLKE